MEKLIDLLKSENKCIMSIDTPLISSYMEFAVESYQVCNDGIIISTEEFDDFHIKTNDCEIKDPDEDGWIEIKKGNMAVLIKELRAA